MNNLTRWLYLDLKFVSGFGNIYMLRRRKPFALFRCGFLFEIVEPTQPGILAEKHFDAKLNIKKYSLISTNFEEKDPCTIIKK